MVLLEKIGFWSFKVPNKKDHFDLIVGESPEDDLINLFDENVNEKKKKLRAEKIRNEYKNIKMVEVKVATEDINNKFHMLYILPRFSAA